ncbi:MAG: hypothetical protein IAI50_10285 [Candidatus Eremiobacteraeota bacterium]|nr:hypothetical protein [Candidatus Eremiobacteraeota bacterium]
MARLKGSGSMGPTRSMRLPQSLDAWFAERLQLHPERSSSELLVALVHGGLRLREGYMAIHRRVLEHYIRSEQSDVYAAYVRCLLDTFGPDYVEHLERWIAADGVRPKVATEVSPANATTARPS